MKRITIKAALFFFAVVMMTGCMKKKEPRLNAEALKHQIYMTEKEFEKAVHEQGVAQAFYQFADQQAVIKRAFDTLICGKENIGKYYKDPLYKRVSMNWAPDFVDVSADGTLGYTYGKYVWKRTDDKGETKEYKGVFHTVWKRQPDGSWRYVWD